MSLPRLSVAAQPTVCVMTSCGGSGNARSLFRLCSQRGGTCAREIIITDQNAHREVLFLLGSGLPGTRNDVCA